MRIFRSTVSIVGREYANISKGFNNYVNYKQEASLKEVSLTSNDNSGDHSIKCKGHVNSL